MVITDLKNSQSQAKLIKTKLLSEGRSYTWLANSCGYSIGHVRNVLTGRDTLTEKMKKKFTEVLNYDL